MLSAIFWVASRAFGDIAHEHSPFTTINSKRIKRLAWAMLAVLVAEALASPEFFSSMNIPGLNAGIVATPDQLGNQLTFIDIKPAVLALVCFGLSYIFEYGALLQQVSDETM